MKKLLLLGLLALALFALGVYVESHGLPNWLPRLALLVPADVNVALGKHQLGYKSIDSTIR